MQNVSKFVKWEILPLESLRPTRAYQAMEKLNSGCELTRQEKDALPTDNGIIKHMGWLFDFRPYMKTYLVKDKHAGWVEKWGFDKTHIRAIWSMPSHVVRILELPEHIIRDIRFGM